MNPFQYNQSSKEKSCGWRCLYFLIPEEIGYDEFLERFKYFSPGKKGITFTAIAGVLDYYKVDYLYTVPGEIGTYLIWSSVGRDGKEWDFQGGHYFIYRNGRVYDTLRSDSYELTLGELIKILETKESRKAFTCMKVLV